MPIVPAPGPLFNLSGKPEITRAFEVYDLSSEGAGVSALRYTEEEAGWRGSWDREGGHATKICAIRWDYLRSFVEWMRGFPYIGAIIETTLPATGPPVEISKPIMRRVLPQPFNRSFGSDLYCTSVDLLKGYGNYHSRYAAVNGWVYGTTDSGGTDAGDGEFSYAQLACHFSSLPYEVSGDLDTPAHELVRYVERKTSYAADNIPVPSGSFKWTTAPHDAIQEGGVPKTFPTKELTYRWCEVPSDVMYIVRTRITQSLGKINAYKFDALPEGGGAPNGYWPGTVLFIGAEEKPIRRLWNDTLLYDVTYKFLHRDNGSSGTTHYGWNYLYRGPGFSPAFQLVTSNGAADGQPIYQSCDTNLLFSDQAAGLGLPGLGG